MRHCKILDVPWITKSKWNHMIFMWEGLLIFKKLAYNKIIYLWGNAQISDNPYRQLTRIIQSYWHNRFHIRSHTCQAQKNTSFVIFPGVLALRVCHREKKCSSHVSNSFDPYSSRYWTCLEGLDSLLIFYIFLICFSDGSVVKNLPVNAGSSPGLGRSLGEGNDNPL